MTKLTYGVGYNSKRKHRLNINNKQSKAYTTWHDMIRRCYDPKTQLKHPTYKGCTVAEEWHDFQNFADWFYSHNYSDMGYQLDKDLLNAGNKIYSPDTCTFVPHEINSLLLDHNTERGKYPQGVYFNKEQGRFMAMLRANGGRRFLGYFDCPNEAYEVYKAEKERHVKNKALDWANRIEWGVFIALMGWSLEN